MPTLDNIAVTNLNTGTVWVTGQRATAPAQPLPAVYNAYVNAATAHQPPMGFFNNPLYQFVIQGQYMADGSAFVSAPKQINPGLTDPPLVYVFT